MATFIADGDPACNRRNWNTVGKGAAGPSGDPATFNPEKLNIQQWADNMKALGAKHAILTAKHGCGHLLWPTEVTLPDGREYIYAVGHSRSAIKFDLLANFSKTMAINSIGHGFYYSLGNNFYLNFQDDKPGHKSTILPGQEYITLEEYNHMIIAHVTELWTKYGDLFEIWLDHGYFNFGDTIKELISTYQSNATAMNGFGVTKSPICWVGTESGIPKSGDVWLTETHNGPGDPNSPNVCPRCVDTTLQDPKTWFWTGAPPFPLSHMIDVYHASVGRNGVLELDFAIDRDGLVSDEHSQRYHEIGNWIRSCYGTPLNVTSGARYSFMITINAEMDRVMIEEDIRHGQRVREYDVSWRSNKTSEWNPWPLLTGKSIGHKRIEIDVIRHVGDLWLNVTTSRGTPVLRFSAFAACAKK